MVLEENMRLKPNAEDGESIIGESYIKRRTIYWWKSVWHCHNKAEDAAATTEPEQVAPITAPATEEVAPQPTVVAIVTEPIDNGYPLDLPEPTAILK